ncbi:unnamed protein product [Fraxinus pennsylvanica]|uniref:FAS1 domain-containing protein n=1 Tax=Fraxinus pennsylvanica TaxID=56036 RepID=A0AAD2A8M4_9LAMI|nr:unnamed protein product [Fraxinus pennsylvanica]
MRQVVVSALTILVLSLLSATTHAHNITQILAKHPEFSTFNHYLTVTHLAAEINRRRTITVCAVDNAAMSEILDKHFSLYTIKNVLSLHIFADYFGAKKLHQIPKGSTTTSSLFQATGEAAGTSGYVNITNSKGGKVYFSPQDSEEEATSTFVKSIDEIPYVVAVIQISHVLLSPEAEAPAGGPKDLNVTSLMAKQGCKAFSDLLTSSGAADTFSQSVEDGKISLLLYHGVPVYQSLGMLRSSNGLMNTLATEGANKYDFTVQNDGEDVKLKTKVVTATIKGTVIDEDPLAVFKIDKILLPRELFKAAPPAPAPKSPKPAKSKAKSGSEEDADAPAPGDDDSVPADETTNSNAAAGIHGGWFIKGIFSLFLGVFVCNI